MTGLANMIETDAGAPRLLVGLNLITLMSLPAWSKAPRGEAAEVLAGVRAAGYEAVQGRDTAGAVAAGLGFAAISRLDRPQEALELAQKVKASGAHALTLHVGTGFETDAEMTALAEAIVEAAEAADLAIYVETHRATMTQDMRRTLDLVARVPALRFNGDFSHWYTGAEMTYGDLAAKLDRLGPVLERTRFLHGRVSSPGAIQVPVRNGENAPHLEVFKTLWTRCFEGFLARAHPGEVFSFYPELLPASFGYARLIPDGEGGLREESDRWEEALFLCEVARAAWTAATAGLREPARV
jgi:hypothetical protein